MKKRLLIAGGSGLIGSALTSEANRRGWETTILSRHPGTGRMVWDIVEGTIDLKDKEVYDAVINLAGASVAGGRWTEKKKKEIYESRINASGTLEKYLRNGQIITSFYHGMSGVGIYGDRGKEIITEETPLLPVEDWFINMTRDWESSHKRIEALGIRTVIMRTSIVLSKEGGALKEIISKPGFAVLSYFGNGEQVWSWIHIHDIVRMIFFYIDHPQSKGIYLASSPHPVTNKVLTKTINQYLSPKRIVAGVPKIVMSLMLGETHRVLFESCHAYPEKILKEGFQFEFPEIDAAVSNLLK
ncbi:MAG TPA: TIGR01777 family oxidoreductase [Saprospiraceae bacterium]|nr:TIGR01777 family oxidoreductase [Saprospiraceae bacterium]